MLQECVLSAGSRSTASMCVAGEGELLLSPETDAEYQLFSPPKSLFHHELEHQLQCSLLCDCSLLSWSNFFFLILLIPKCELGSSSIQKGRTGFILKIMSAVHKSHEYQLLFLFKVRCENREWISCLLS